MSKNDSQDLDPNKVNQILKVVREIIVLIGMFIAGNAAAGAANIHLLSNFNLF